MANEPDTMITAGASIGKRPWVEPRVDVLDVTETNILIHLGNDGQPDPSALDCLRS